MHRHFLEQAANSCGKLSDLLKELSELSLLESGKATYNRGNLVLKTILTDAVAALPDLTDRSLAIEVSVKDGVLVHGDAVRLRFAFVSLLHAIRREILSATVCSSGSGRRRRTITPSGLRSPSRRGLMRLNGLTPPRS